VGGIVPLGAKIKGDDRGEKTPRGQKFPTTN